VLTGGCTQSSATNCEKKNLLNVSGVTVCVACATGTNQVSGITGVDTLEGTSSNTLQGKIQGMDGWYTTLCDDATCTTPKGERAMNSPVILGGIVLFPTFTPTNDPCQASGTGSLYALFYLTGSAYKESVIGTETSGSNTNVKRKASVGEGLPSQMAVQIGTQGSDGNGGGSGGGCTGQVTLLSQSSTGATSQMCGKVKQAWSHYVSWINQRD
jgi:type IV pilus assembly protein PilY1